MNFEGKQIVRNLIHSVSLCFYVREIPRYLRNETLKQDNLEKVINITK